MSRLLSDVYHEFSYELLFNIGMYYVYFIVFTLSRLPTWKYVTRVATYRLMIDSQSKTHRLVEPSLTESELLESHLASCT